MTETILEDIESGEVEPLVLEDVIEEMVEMVREIERSREYSAEQVVDRLFYELGIQDTLSPDREIIRTTYQPHPLQAKVHEEAMYSRFILLVCHRRWGKTVFGTESLREAAMLFKPINGLPGRFAYLAPFLKQAKQVSWLYIKASAAQLPGSKKNESELYVELANGSRITLYGGDNAEAMRGLYIDGIVIDEPANIKGHVWGEIVRPALADRKGWAIWIGTPNGMDSFYEQYEKALEDDAWAVFLFRADETNLPWLDDEELELVRRELSDAEYRQEFLCDFTASSDNVIIPIDLVSEAAARVVPSEAHLQGLVKVMGVDVARFGGDRSCIVKRWGHFLYEPEVHEGLDNMQLVGRIAQTIQQFDPDAVFIDGGRGEGVIDRLRQLGYDVTEVNFGAKATNPHYKNMRTEMMFNFRDWLESGGVLPNSPGLKTELSATTYSFNARNQAEACKKEDVVETIGRSPDEADGCILTVAYPVVPRGIRHNRDHKYNASATQTTRGGYHPHNKLKARAGR